jgi:hypothetical protein
MQTTTGTGAAARIAVVAALAVLGTAAVGAAALSSPRKLEHLHVLARIRLGDLGAGITYADGAVWAQTVARNELVRIDPKTNRITNRLKLPDATSGDAEQVAPPPAYGAGSLWIVAAGRDPHARRDHESRRAHDRCRLRLARHGPRPRPGRPEVEPGHGNRARATPEENPPCGPDTQYNCFPGVTFGDGSVWAVDNSRHEVLRVAPG